MTGRRTDPSGRFHDAGPNVPEATFGCPPTTARLS